MEMYAIEGPLDMEPPKHCTVKSESDLMVGEKNRNTAKKGKKEKRSKEGKKKKRTKKAKDHIEEEEEFIIIESEEYLSLLEDDMDDMDQSFATLLTLPMDDDLSDITDEDEPVRRKKTKKAKSKRRKGRRPKSEADLNESYRTDTDHNYQADIDQSFQTAIDHSYRTQPSQSEGADLNESFRTAQSHASYLEDLRRARCSFELSFEMNSLPRRPISRRRVKKSTEAEEPSSINSDDLDQEEPSPCRPNRPLRRPRNSMEKTKNAFFSDDIEEEQPSRPDRPLRRPRNSMEKNTKDKSKARRKGTRKSKAESN